MQVVQVDVDLPVENISKITHEMDQLAGPRGVQLVVIAEEPAASIVGYKDVRARIDPQAVAADLDLLGQVFDADIVADRRVHHVVGNLYVGDVVGQDAGRRVVRELVVRDLRVALGLLNLAGLPSIRLNWIVPLKSTPVVLR